MNGTFDELTDLIARLRQYDSLNQDLCSWLEAFMARNQPVPELEPEPEPEPVITLDQVRGVLADKSRLGHTQEVKALLTKYGAAKLSQVDPANYAALLADAEELA